MHHAILCILVIALHQPEDAEVCWCAGKGQPVTLVQTGVEGSAELWQWGAAAMTEARKLHDAILHARLRHFHGYAAAGKTWKAEVARALMQGARLLP